MKQNFDLSQCSDFQHQLLRRLTHSHRKVLRYGSTKVRASAPPLIKGGASDGRGMKVIATDPFTPLHPRDASGLLPIAAAEIPNREGTAAALTGEQRPCALGAPAHRQTVLFALP
jgi:hypothetical protein